MQTAEGLIRLAAAGGGFAVDANKCPVEDLIRIATAGAGKGQFVVNEFKHLQIEDLIRIAAAGKGRVFLKGCRPAADLKGSRVAAP